MLIIMLDSRRIIERIIWKEQMQLVRPGPQTLTIVDSLTPPHKLISSIINSASKHVCQWRLVSLPVAYFIFDQQLPVGMVSMSCPDNTPHCPIVAGLQMFLAKTLTINKARAPHMNFRVHRPSSVLTFDLDFFKSTKFRIFILIQCYALLNFFFTTIDYSFCSFKYEQRVCELYTKKD